MNLNKEKNFCRLYGFNTHIHNFSKIMLVSCVRVKNNVYELIYLLNYIYQFNEDRILLKVRTMIDFNQYNLIRKYKFGIWINYKKIDLNYFYIYIYKNIKNNRLIHKITKNNNFLTSGSINQYNHELLFKGFLSGNEIIEIVR